MFFPDTEVAVIIIIFAVISMWLYKKLQEQFNASEKFIQAKTEKAIEVYAQLDFEIRKAIKENTRTISLEEIFIKASVFLPNDIVKRACEWLDESKEDLDTEKLAVIRGLINNEFLRLKQSQLDAVSHKSIGGISEFIKVYYKTKLSFIVEPIIHTIVGIMVLMIFLFGVSVFSTTQETTNKILLLSLFFAFILFVLVLDIIVSDILAQGRFRHSKRNWFIFIAFILLSLFLLYTGPWYRGLLVIFLTFLYAFYSIKFSIKKIN